MTDLLEQQLRGGDEHALAALFATYRERLWKIVSFRLDPRMAQRVDPDDVLQEAFMAARSRLEHFVRDPMPAFLWLRLITVQTLHDQYRRHGGAQRDMNRDVAIDRFSADETSVALLHCLSCAGPSPSSIVAREDFVKKIEEHIAQLEPVDREVIALRHYEELSNGESARVLGIQEKAASIRYMRALRRLRELLGAMLDSSGGAPSV